MLVVVWLSLLVVVLIVMVVVGIRVVLVVFCACHIIGDSAGRWADALEVAGATNTNRLLLYSFVGYFVDFRCSFAFLATSKRYGRYQPTQWC